MNCRKTKKLLTKYSGNLRNGLKEGEKLTDFPPLPKGGRGDLEEHLSVCSECCRKLAFLARTEQLLFAIPQKEPSAGLWDGLRARIVAEADPSEGGRQFRFSEFRKAEKAEGGRTKLIPRFVFRTPHSFAALAAFAILLIFAGVFFLRPFFSQESISPDGLYSIYVGQHALRTWRDPLADKAWLGWSVQLTTEDHLRRGLPQEMKLKNQ